MCLLLSSRCCYWRCYVSDVVVSIICVHLVRLHLITPISGFPWYPAARWPSTPSLLPLTLLRPPRLPHSPRSHVTSTRSLRPMSRSLTTNPTGSRLEPLPVKPEPETARRQMWAAIGSFLPDGSCADASRTTREPISTQLQTGSRLMATTKRPLADSRNISTYASSLRKVKMSSSWKQTEAVQPCYRHIARVSALKVDRQRGG